MRILVTFAVEAEFAPWRKLRKFRAGPAKVGRSYSSMLTGDDQASEISVLLTGIGRESCLAAVQKWTDVAARPDLVISSGFAGALQERLRPGCVVVPERTHTLRDDADVICDPELRQAAIDLGATPIATTVTVDQLVKTRNEKSKSAFYGEAVDMESALILSHFKNLGATAMALRTISDGALENLPLDFDRCLTPQGTIRTISLVKQIVRSPGRLPDLIRFGRQSYQAGLTLGHYLERFIKIVPTLMMKKAAKA